MQIDRRAWLWIPGSAFGRPGMTRGDSQAAVTLAPLLSASPAIKLHAFAAMAAFALGVVQLSAPKGTLPHRAIGWLWVVLMLVTSRAIEE